MCPARSAGSTPTRPRSTRATAGTTGTTGASTAAPASRWYWTDHWKTEIEGGASSAAELRTYTQTIIDGRPATVYSEHRFSTRRLAIGQQYQFYRNVWVHPFVTAGLDLTWERPDRRDEIYSSLPSQSERAPTRTELLVQAVRHRRAEGLLQFAGLLPDGHEAHLRQRRGRSAHPDSAWAWISSRVDIRRQTSLRRHDHETLHRIAALRAARGSGVRGESGTSSAGRADQCPRASAVDREVLGEFARQLPLGARIRATVAGNRTIRGTLLKRTDVALVIQPRARVAEPLVEIPFSSLLATRTGTHVERHRQSRGDWRRRRRRGRAGAVDADCGGVGGRLRQSSVGSRLSGVQSLSHESAVRVAVSAVPVVSPTRRWT